MSVRQNYNDESLILEDFRNLFMNYEYLDLEDKNRDYELQRESLEHMKFICMEVLKMNGLENMFNPIYNISIAGLIQIRINKKYTSDDMDIN